MLWATFPAIAVGFAVALRDDYVMRDFASEYSSRLKPNTVRWADFKAYRMECPEGERRVVVLDTHEFEESAREFLARRFPECPRRTKERRKGLPELFSGVALNRG
jgi:hypothetical protein